MLRTTSSSPPAPPPSVNGAEQHPPLALHELRPATGAIAQPPTPPRPFPFAEPPRLPPRLPLALLMALGGALPEPFLLPLLPLLPAPFPFPQENSLGMRPPQEVPQLPKHAPLKGLPPAKPPPGSWSKQPGPKPSPTPVHAPGIQPPLLLPF